MKSLDLTFMNNATWSVILPNEVTIEVKKPTQKLLRLLESKIKLVESEKNPSKQLEKLTSLTKILLSNNKDDVVVGQDILDDLTTDMLYAIYLGYMEFVNEVR